MDKSIQILLNSFKNIASVDVDNFNKIEVDNKPMEINEYDIRNVLSATEIFDAEREANPIYRISGKIEFMSMLNGLKNTYSTFSDFFYPELINSKNASNSFDYYLVRPTSGYTQVISGGSTILWIRYFKVIATPSDFDIYPAGFSNNVYGEQAYAFNFNKDFNVAPYLDNFGFPATELFLYAQYKNSSSPAETFYFTQWNNTAGVVSPKLAFVPKALVIGDVIKTTAGDRIGDLIEYSKSTFYQAQLSPQAFYIRTPYSGGYLQWKYNPLIPFTLRYFNDNLSKANISGTSYEQVNSIPYYATDMGNGNRVWRTIMPQGYFDPLTGIGVDYPFVNKKRYLFSNIILSVAPDLNDASTLAKFSEIWFSRFATPLDITPVGDINNIGKPCL